MRMAALLAMIAHGAVTPGGHQRPVDREGVLSVDGLDLSDHARRHRIEGNGSRLR